MNDTQSYINRDARPPTRPAILAICEEICNQLVHLEKGVESLSRR